MCTKSYSTRVLCFSLYFCIILYRGLNFFLYETVPPVMNPAKEIARNSIPTTGEVSKEIVICPFLIYPIWNNANIYMVLTKKMTWELLLRYSFGKCLFQAEYRKEFL